MERLTQVALVTCAAAVSVLAGAGGASATTLEVNGVLQNQAVPITASLEPTSTLLLANTSGTLSSTCKHSHLSGSTIAPFTNTTKATGPISSLTFTTCHVESVTVHKAGQLWVEHIAGTTNGTVFWENAEVTVPTTLGNTVNCKTGAGTHIGILKEATTASNPRAHARIEVRAVINCGFLLPSARWAADYIVTSPTDLGVVA